MTLTVRQKGLRVFWRRGHEYLLLASGMFSTDPNPYCPCHENNEAKVAETDESKPMKRFICQLPHASQSLQIAVLQIPDQPLNRASAPTGFGTLERLPIEIRQRIWLEALKSSFPPDRYLGSEPIEYLGGNSWYIKNLQHHGHYSTRSRNATDTCHVFGLESYLFTTDYHDVGDPLNWVMAKPVPRFEFMFLTRHNFAFQCPLSLELLLDQLSEDQLCRLRRISFIMFVCGHCQRKSSDEDWLRVCERLPKTLNYVYLQLGGHRHATFAKPYGKLPKNVRRRSLATLDILRNHILRNVPDARFRMEGPMFERLAASDYAAFDGLVRDTLSLRLG